MRHLLTGLLLVALAVPALRADDKKPDAKATKATEEFQALKNEYDAAQKKLTAQLTELRKKYRDAKDADEKKEIQKQFEETVSSAPGRKFGPRFLEFAEKNPKDPSTVQALELALQSSDGPKGKGGTWAKVIGILDKDYVKEPGIKRLVRMLASSDDEASEQFVRDVQEKNPDRVVQARAAQALANAAEDLADNAGRLKENKEMRERLELQRGKEFVQKFLDKGEKAKHDFRELDKLLKTKYADIVPDMSVGKKAPEVVGKDFDGKATKLSDLKGKVVVLDFWATWCGPCKAMIPHDRALVSKLKDKPFVFISISADDEQQTVKDFLADTPMPWTHWYNGPEGGIVEEWNVRYYPSVYVLDAKGVIRLDPKTFINAEDREEKLEEVVTDLLKEAEKKGSN